MSSPSDTALLENSCLILATFILIVNYDHIQHPYSVVGLNCTRFVDAFTKHGIPAQMAPDLNIKQRTTEEHLQSQVNRDNIDWFSRKRPQYNGTYTTSTL